MVSLDINTVASILAAATTLALAIAAFQAIGQNKKQLELLAGQTRVFQSQQAPIAIIKSFQFEQNSLKISVENIGTGPISLLVLRTLAVPTKITYLDGKDGPPIEDMKTLQRAFDEKRQLYWRYDMKLQSEFKYEDNRVTLFDTVRFLHHPERKGGILLPKESATFAMEPLFGFKYKNRPPEASYPRFPEVKKMLESNGVTALAVDFDIMGRDMVDKPIQSQPMAKFVVDFSKHETLEHAFKENHRPYFLPLDSQEVLGDFPMSADDYSHSSFMVHLLSET